MLNDSTKNKFFTTLNICLLLLVSVTTVTCGLNDSVDENASVFDIGQMDSACELDTSKLSKLLEESVQKEISCFHSSLNMFVNFVALEDPEYISLHELSRFIDKFLPPSDVNTNEYLGLLFNLNSLLLKDPADKISVKNLPLLFDLFRYANIHGVVLNKLIKEIMASDDNDDYSVYWEIREDIYLAVRDFRIDFLKIMTQRPANDSSKINIKEFLAQLKIALGLAGDVDFTFIENFLFIKKLLLGGEENIVTSREIEDLLGEIDDKICEDGEVACTKNIENLMILGMDIMYEKSKKYNNDSEQSYFFIDILRDFEAMFFPFPDDAHILKQENLISAAGYILKDINFETFPNSIQKIKENFIGGEPTNYTFKDVKNILQLGLEYFSTNYFSNITYTYFNNDAVMLSPSKIVNLLRPSIKDIPEYAIFSEDQLNNLWQPFRTIALNYRLFPDDFHRVSDFSSISYYGNDYRRYKKGFITISFIRWAINKAFSFYGKNHNGEIPEKVFREEMIPDFKEALVEFGFWPKGDVKQFTQEAVNSSDFFELQSDGNLAASVDEFTEYLTTIVSSYTITDSIFNRIKLRTNQATNKKEGYCPIIDEKDKIFKNECYQKYFYKVLFEELDLGENFPLLKAYYDKASADVRMKYLQALDVFARQDKKAPLTNINITDQTRLLIAFSHIEGLYMRFDYDKTTIFTRNELDDAYTRFEKMIKMIMDARCATKKQQDTFAHSVFLYMVDKQEVPSNIQLALFHYLGAKSKITSDRLRIGSIMQHFGNDKEKKDCKKKEK